MRVSRVNEKDSDLVVFVISAESEELLELAKTIIVASKNPNGAHALIRVGRPNERTIIVNDGYFENIGDSGCIEKQTETSMDKYINAHIIKWNIKPKQSVRPPKRPKDNRKRTKIEVK